MEQEAMSVGAGSDVSLVARARAGDETAWTAIVELHWQRVWGLSRIVVRDQQGAEEVAQETFRAARERLAGYSGGGSLCGWIQGVCRQRALEELRRRGRQPRQAETADEPGVRRPDLERALRRLEPDEREALLLTVAGTEPEDLASTLGVPVATIRSRAARARAQVLDELEPGGAR